MKLSFVAAALAAVLCSGPAFAAPVSYQADPDHTYANFSYQHLGLTVQSARFNEASGTVVFDKEARQASVDVAVTMSSVDTGTASFDKRIQEPDFLGAAEFPKATFKSKAVRFEGDKPVEVQGDLTIKGVTKPVTMKVTTFALKDHPMLKKPMLGAEGIIDIKRTEFNAGKFVPLVADEVRLHLVIEAMVK